MTAKRIKPTDVCMSDAMPFNQHWEARVAATADELGEMISDELLLNGGNLFRSGDQVSIVAFENTGWTQMTGVIDVRVISVSRDAVRLMKVSDVIAVEKPEPEVTENQPNDRFYVTGCGGGMFAVYDKNAKKGRQKGQAVDTFKTREDAEAFANEHNGIREAA